MKRTIALCLALMVCGLTTTSCEGELDSCVKDQMEEGLSQSEAEDKCDEDLVEAVEVLR